MATCTPPTTHSPGFLFIKYNQSTIAFHTARFAFIVGVDPTDTVNLRIEANRLASAMADALNNQFVLTDWGIMGPDGVAFLQEGFVTPYIGTHSTAVGSESYFSRTITFTGHGNSPAPGVCRGQTRHVLFCGSTYQFLPAQKRYNVLTDVDLDSWRLALNASTYLPADEYGQQVDFSPSAPVQLNAHTQKTVGT